MGTANLPLFSRSTDQAMTDQPATPQQPPLVLFTRRASRRSILLTWRSIRLCRKVRDLQDEELIPLAPKLQKLLGGVRVYLRSSTDRRQPAIGYSRMLDGTANRARKAVNIHTKSEIIYGFLMKKVQPSTRIAEN